MDWNEAEIETLKKLCAQGLSFSRIGAIMGISRSAAIGKASRLRIPKSPAKPTGRKRNPVTAEGKRILTPRLHRLNFETQMKAAPIPQPVKQADDAPAPLMIPLLDLEPHMCRWPCGDPRDPGFGFCGHNKKRGSAWCEYHESIAWAGRPQMRATRPMRRAA